MPDHGTQRHRPLRDGGGKAAAAHLLDVTAQELGEVGGVAADVGERARTGGALVAPADRSLGIAGVVAPVPGVHMQDLTQGPRRHEVAQGSNPRCPAEGETDAGDRVGRPSHFGHGAGIVQGVAERLLAQHVLSGRQQAFDDLAVQGVGHHHTDHLDLGVVRDRLPRGVGALVPEALSRKIAELRAHVSDGHESERRQRGRIERRRDPVAGGVRPAGHSGPDHGNAYRH